MLKGILDNAQLAQGRESVWSLAMRPFTERPIRWQADPMWTNIARLREYVAMFLAHRRLRG